MKTLLAAMLLLRACNPSPPTPPIVIEPKIHVNDIVYAISEYELHSEFVIKIDDAGPLPGTTRNFTLVDNTGVPCSPACGYIEVLPNGDGKHVPQAGGAR